MHATDWPGTHPGFAPPSVDGGLHVHDPNAVPVELQTWFEAQPPGPVHATDCPGTQSVLASAGGVLAASAGEVLPASAEWPQTHGPYAAPDGLQTWLDAQPPGPEHASERPGTQPAEPASMVGFVNVLPPHPPAIPTTNSADTRHPFQLGIGGSLPQLFPHASPPELLTELFTSCS
jgi:hypothetical protein